MRFKIFLILSLAAAFPCQAIIINEVMPSPEGPDSEEEYIEIFNEGENSVDISGWCLEDGEGRTKAFCLPEKNIIEGKEFLVFFRPQTKITMNNTGDDIKLSNKKGEIIDEVSYQKAPTGESFSKIGKTWQWTSLPTPGKENSLPLLKEKTANKENLVEIESEDKENVQEKIPLQNSFFPQENKKKVFPVFLKALLIASFSGLCFFLVNKNLKKGKRKIKF